MFNEYSDWITLQKFYYFDSFFSIAYNKDDKYLVAVYQIPEHIINDDKLKLGVETHTMIGGTEGNFNKKQGPLIMYIFRGLTVSNIPYCVELPALLQRGARRPE